MWLHIQEQAQRSNETGLVFKDVNLPKRILRDFVREDTQSIMVDSRETLQSLLEFAELYASSALSKLKHYQGDRPLFDLYQVEAEINRAMSRKVELKSGGYLIFDQTEAMTTVDVNTGGLS